MAPGGALMALVVAAAGGSRICYRALLFVLLDVVVQAISHIVKNQPKNRSIPIVNSIIAASGVQPSQSVMRPIFVRF